MDIFITASDTDAGKTFVTCLLYQKLRQRGLRVGAIKPIASGGTGQGSDIDRLLKAQGLLDVGKISTACFDLPADPYAAAKAEGKTLSLYALQQSLLVPQPDIDLRLIEGVGGLMVPLTEDETLLDFLKLLQPMLVLLIVNSRLGGINHALLSLHALRSYSIEPQWIVVNDAADVGAEMMQRHTHALRRYGGYEGALFQLSHRPIGDTSELDALLDEIQLAVSQ